MKAAQKEVDFSMGNVDLSSLFLELQNFVHDLAIPRAEEIVFDKSDELQFSQVAIYCSLLEQSWSILALVQKGLGYQAYTILRSQIELYSDFKNLFADENYILGMKLQRAMSKKKQLISAKRGNPYLAPLSEIIDIDRELSELGRDIKQLEKMGAKDRKPQERLKMAGLVAEYEALYPMLCDHSHGNLRALISRHTHEHESDFEVVAFHRGEADEFDALLDTSYQIAIEASLKIHEKFATKNLREFNELHSAFRARSSVQ